MTEQRLIGESNAFQEVLEQVSRLAQIPRPLLIIGERGTGKELIAARLHFLSARWQQPLISLNCAALPETLLETELFGHEAGAFTGASKRHLGRFERADGGTLFLDELASMSARLQEKLLRVIEYGELERVGGQQTLQVDVRLLCATNADLPQRVQTGHFRADLLDRLAFDVITLPPLRVRQEDILLLAQHFAEQLCQELGWPAFAGFSAEVTRRLLTYSWPGNVRELRNVIERSLVREARPAQPLTELSFDPFASPWRPAPSQDQAEPETTTLNWKQYWAQMEQTRLREMLRLAHYNQRVAAQNLGLSYDQLRGLLRKYGLTGRPDSGATNEMDE